MQHEARSHRRPAGGCGAKCQRDRVPLSCDPPPEQRRNRVLSPLLPLDCPALSQDLKSRGVQTVSPAKAQELVAKSNYLIVDCRPKGQYDAAHPEVRVCRALVFVCVCVRVWVGACMRACVWVWVYLCVRAYACLQECIYDYACF